ncbi:type II toxin-antitoxin system prevent-host-death family antitoxin [Actinoallomurus purpureus]|uniref:type II toxin-antitoxin system Phd/YefM family antitoxin n=1 Tax=Actinoallomurus purpureus TaxID=478114 RepID=UPI0020929F0D|nr:type II toxin-antitoxin system prevent-host-death family antitoxin [Actinoallomurus purpureus]MCO6009114.1 type II toxin-antitoxin system prevent-host-death family antitoxin [Actinoallomurus purpureus]
MRWAISINLIIRYAGLMRTMTATEASRRFSDLLDAIERGETITITRGNRPVAEIGPAHRRTGADLRAALDGIEPPDDRFAEDINSALDLLTTEERDPWADA